MPNVLLFPLALLCGVLVAIQIGANGTFAQLLRTPFIPTLVNMATGTAAAAALVLLATDTWPSRADLQAVPWPYWVAGGLLGATYITGSILLAPRLGAGIFVALVVAGQILFSVLLDHFGWLGFAQHTASLPRLAGCGLLIVGVALVARF